MARIKFTLLLFTFLLGSIAMAQTNTWRDIYKVKKKDTIYGIAQSYGLSVEELMNANPEMKDKGYNLKKGTMVFIPFPSQKVVAPAPTTSKTTPHSRLRVGVMLPLHASDADGRRMVEYYRGLLMACDTLRNSGVSTDIYAWDLPSNADPRTILADPRAKELDIIFGPFYTKQVRPLADFCSKNDIKLVIPFSTEATDVQTNDHVYQVYQSSAMLNQRAINAFLDRFKDAHPIFIDCNDSTSTKGPFTSALRKSLDSQGVAYNLTSLSSPEENFRKAFVTNKTNVVIPNTANPQKLAEVFARLDKMREEVSGVDISMFGYTEWLMYESANRQAFHTYDVYIPATFYYYKGLSRTANFEQNYRRWFDEGLQERYIPRMGLAGYDHAQFFLTGLYNKGSDFRGTARESSYKPLQTPLRFAALEGYKGMQNTAFQLVHYRKVGLIETISY